MTRVKDDVRIAYNPTALADAIRSKFDSQKELAALIGVSPSWVSQAVTTGAALMTEQRLNLIAHLCGVHPEAFAPATAKAEEEKKAEEPKTIEQTINNTTVQVTLTDEQLQAVMEKLDSYMEWAKAAYTQLRKDENVKYDGAMNAVQRIQKVLVDTFNLMKYGRTN